MRSLLNEKEIYVMKKRILAILSLVLCLACVFSCVACEELIGDETDAKVTDETIADGTEKKTEKQTEKKTDKKTDKKTEAETDAPGPVPGVTTTTEALLDKTYNFANMSRADQAYFKLLGRAQTSSSGLIFDLSCATIEFQGYMTGDVVVEISSKKGGYDFGNSYFTVYVDGERVDTRFEVGNNKTEKLTIASFEGKYYHTVKIVKQTESKWSLATIKNLSITGFLTEAPAKKSVYIEFLGDSLTAAYGNVGRPGNEPSDSPDYQDGTKSYAYLLAESLNADYTMLARSAAGVNQCWSNVPMIDYYKKISKGRSDDAFDISRARRPDVIVIHLGANDYNVAREENGISAKEKQDFVNKGIELVTYLRDNYNYGVNVPIIWAYDPGEGFPSEVQQIADHFGGEAGSFYTIALPWSEAGAGGHPSANEHAKHAQLVADLIKNKNIL